MMIILRNCCVQSEKPWVPTLTWTARGLLNGITSRVMKTKNGTWENASADPTPELGSSASGHLVSWEQVQHVRVGPETQSIQTYRICLLVSCFIGAFPGGEMRKKSHKRRQDCCIIRLLQREKTNITGSSVPPRWTSSIYRPQTDQATGC